MSKRSKKYKMKKPLTEAERERRKKLREQRNERQRLTDINSRRRFWRWFFLIAGIVAIGVFTAAAEIKRLNHKKRLIMYCQLEEKDV